LRGPDPGRGDLGQRLGQHERRVIAVGIAYVIGLSGVLLLWALGGRKVIA